MNIMYDMGSLQYKSDPYSVCTCYLLYILFGIADVDRK